MDFIFTLLIVLATSVAPPPSPAPVPMAPTQGELTESAIDLFVLSEPPCKVADFRFIIRPKMVVAACDDLAIDDFAGMFLVDGMWRPGTHNTP